MSRLRASLCCAALVFAAPAFAEQDPAPAAEPSQPPVLRVEIQGLRSDKGTVLVWVYTSADGFPDKTKKAIATAAGTIKDGTSTVEFSGLNPGLVAVATCHDENDNKQCDTNFLGIPKEGVACSNRAHHLNMIPKYDKAKLSLAPTGVTRAVVAEYKY
jgi:uncharacterized protein (DUF2141 family)